MVKNVHACIYTVNISLILSGAYQAGEASGGACSCALHNINSEIQTWCPMLILVSLAHHSSTLSGSREARTCREHRHDTTDMNIATRHLVYVPQVFVIHHR